MPVAPAWKSNSSTLATLGSASSASTSACSRCRFAPLSFSSAQKVIGPRTNATLPASSRTSGLAASIRTGIGKSNVTVSPSRHSPVRIQVAVADFTGHAGTIGPRLRLARGRNRGGSSGLLTHPTGQTEGQRKASRSLSRGASSVTAQAHDRLAIALPRQVRRNIQLHSRYHSTQLWPRRPYTSA